LNKTFCNWVNCVTDHYAIEWSGLNRSHYDDYYIQHYAAWANAQKPFNLVWRKKVDFKLWRLQKQNATVKVTKNGQNLFGDIYNDNIENKPEGWCINRTAQNIIRLCDVIKIRWISGSKTTIRDTKDAFADNNFHSMVVHIK